MRKKKQTKENNKKEKKVRLCCEANVVKSIFDDFEIKAFLTCLSYLLSSLKKLRLYLVFGKFGGLFFPKSFNFEAIVV